MPPPPYALNHSTPVVDSSMVDQDDEAGSEEEEDEIDDMAPSDRQEMEDAKTLAGLRDINALATWTLSSSKPGCGLAQLRHQSPSQFWQSDGPQPHTLTLHFSKLVSIVKMRIYLDFELDESYTPTKMRFFAGMSEHGLVEFGSWDAGVTDPNTNEGGIDNVRGWIEIPLHGAGGRETTDPAKKPPSNTLRLNKKVSDTRRKEIKRRKREAWLRDVGMDPNNLAQYDPEEIPPLEDFSSEGDEELSDVDAGTQGGDVLKAMVVQIRICENHQNGKDTHVRGFQVFARDEKATITSVGDAINQRDSSRTGVGTRDGRDKDASVQTSEPGSSRPRTIDLEIVREAVQRRAVRGKQRKEAGTGCGEGESGEADDEFRGGAYVGIEEAEWMGEPEIR